MIDFRCKKCSTLLGKEEIKKGVLEIKCYSCNTFNTLVIEESTYSNKDKKINPWKSETRDNSLD